MPLIRGAATAKGVCRFVGMLGLCFAVGCGSDRLPVTPVNGQVIYRGKPLPFGSVLFQPDVGPVASGIIQSDGRFSLTTYEQGDGAVIGKHRVTVTCFESQRPGTRPPNVEKEEASAGDSLIPAKYNTAASSGLVFEITAPQNEPLVLELSDQP